MIRNDVCVDGANLSAQIVHVFGESVASALRGGWKRREEAVFHVDALLSGGACRAM